MAEYKDYYKILGLDRNASKSDIKTAYRKLAKLYHPDSNQNDIDAEKKFQDISEAYSILSDENKKRQYDQYGSTASSDNQDSEQGFSDIFSMFGDIFGNSAENQRRVDTDIFAYLTISFREAAFGCVKQVNIISHDICDKCNGTGALSAEDIITCEECNGSGREVHVKRTQFGIQQNISTCSKCGGKGKTVKNKCPECGGSGIINKTRCLSIDIPMGINNGEAIRVCGSGNMDIPNGERGDLYITIEIEEDEFFFRDNYDVHTIERIPYETFINGGEITVKTLYGDEIYEVPPHTPDAEVIRLEGKGITSLQNNVMQGSQYTTLLVDIP